MQNGKRITEQNAASQFLSLFEAVEKRRYRASSFVFHPFSFVFFFFFHLILLLVKKYLRRDTFTLHWPLLSKVHWRKAKEKVLIMNISVFLGAIFRPHKLGNIRSISSLPSCFQSTVVRVVLPYSKVSSVTLVRCFLGNIVSIGWLSNIFFSNFLADVSYTQRNIRCIIVHHYYSQKIKFRPLQLDFWSSLSVSLLLEKTENREMCQSLTTSPICAFYLLLKLVVFLSQLFSRFMGNYTFRIITRIHRGRVVTYMSGVFHLLLV